MPLADWRLLMHRVSIALEFTMGQVGLPIDLEDMTESIEELVASAGGLDVQVEVVDVEAV